MLPFFQLHEGCWAPLLELARQPLFLPFGKRQNFDYLHPPNNDLLSPSLVVTVRYSAPISFQFDETTDYVREKGYLSWNCQGNPSSRLDRRPVIIEMNN